MSLSDPAAGPATGPRAEPENPPAAEPASEPEPAYHLAQVNIGRILGPLDGPLLADFVAQLPEINALADHAPGFVWRMTDEDGADSTSLRPDDHDDLLLINCSVWASVQALKDYTYRSEHLRVLSRRREWFEKLSDHYLALWWVPAGHRPTAAEAMERVALLREHGPGPHAFTFRDPQPPPTTPPASTVPTAPTAPFAERTA